MYHLRLKGKPYEMGKKRGEIFKKCGIVFPIKLDQFQKKLGEASGRILRENFPEAYQEILGITDAMGVDHSDFLSWMMCMGCCMYNLEENHPEIRGCTAFAFTLRGQVYYGRNNDLPPFLKNGSKAEIYQPWEGIKFYMTTSSFVNGEEGMNEYGLVVAMTFVLSNLDRIKPGFNSVFIVRYLLEKAKSTQEAIILLKKIPIASSCNILLVDKTGDMIVAECSPEKIHIRLPEVNRTGEKILCTVNQFTSDIMKKFDDSDGNIFFSKERYEVTMKALYNMSGEEDPIEYSKNLLSGKYGFMCQYPKAENFETIWSTLFEINSLRIFRAEGNPLRKKFILDERLLKISE